MKSVEQFGNKICQYFRKGYKNSFFKGETEHFSSEEMHFIFGKQSPCSAVSIIKKIISFADIKYLLDA